MSTFACEDDGEPERKSYTGDSISDAEIYEFIDNDLGENKKPSTEHLQDRIEDLEFELDCCKEYNKHIDKRLNALKMLLQAVDVQRFQGKNQTYIKNVIEKIINIIS